MNTVSILLYIADLGGSLAVFSGFLWFLLISLISYIIISNIDNGEGARMVFKQLKVSLWFSLLLIFTFSINLIPSKETMHLIIASELGEDAINSQVATEFKNALIDTIKSYKKD